MRSWTGTGASPLMAGHRWLLAGEVVEEQEELRSIIRRFLTSTGLSALLEVKKCNLTCFHLDLMFQ